MADTQRLAKMAPCTGRLPALAAGLGWQTRSEWIANKQIPRHGVAEGIAQDECSHLLSRASCVRRPAMTELRLAELIAALSQTTDLGMGQPPETAIRTCLLATALAHRMNLSDQDVGDVYYTTLLQHVGCTAYAHETARAFGGDDIALRAAGAAIDFENPREALPYLLTGIGKGAPPLSRARIVINAFRLGSSFDEALSRSNCEAAVNIAGRLGMGAGVQHGLKRNLRALGWAREPHRTSRARSFPCRHGSSRSPVRLPCSTLIGGPDLAIATIQRRAGGALDPAIASAFVRHGRTMPLGHRLHRRRHGCSRCGA